MNIEQFNEYFYTTGPLAYLFINLGLSSILMVMSYYILQAQPNADYNEFYDEDDTADQLKQATDSKLISKNNGSGVTKDKPDTCLYPIASSLFKSPHWQTLPLFVYPYFGNFLGAISGSIIRLSFGFMIVDPPPGYDSNFDGFLPIFYLCLIPILSIA